MSKTNKQTKKIRVKQNKQCKPKTLQLKLNQPQQPATSSSSSSANIIKKHFHLTLKTIKITSNFNNNKTVILCHHLHRYDKINHHDIANIITKTTLLHYYKQTITIKIY